MTWNVLAQGMQGMWNKDEGSNWGGMSNLPKYRHAFAVKVLTEVDADV